jgi:hypothetical protein
VRKDLSRGFTNGYVVLFSASIKIYFRVLSTVMLFCSPGHKELSQGINEGCGVAKPEVTR